MWSDSMYVIDSSAGFSMGEAPVEQGLPIWPLLLALGIGGAYFILKGKS